jgi:hypothetical protein
MEETIGSTTLNHRSLGENTCTLTIRQRWQQRLVHDLSLALSSAALAQWCFHLAQSEHAQSWALTFKCVLLKRHRTSRGGNSIFSPLCLLLGLVIPMCSAFVSSVSLLPQLPPPVCFLWLCKPLKGLANTCPDIVNIKWTFSFCASRQQPQDPHFSLWSSNAYYTSHCSRAFAHTGSCLHTVW